MILKKPYAFLIKHFRLIHMILLGFLSYILYRSYNVFSFVDNYLNSSKLNLVDNLSGTFITLPMYIVTIVIIIIMFTILLLMNFKKKNTKYYLISTVFYIVLIFIFIFVSYQLKQIEWNEINIQIVKITRDILLVSYLFQIPFLFVSLVRTIGFNIKKFNFERDIKEFEIDELDNEEFEVGVNLDNNDIKTIVTRRKRVFRYFIKENKYLVILFISLLMIGTGTLIYVNKEVYNKVYKENEELNTSSVKVKVLSSYQLDTNSSNNDITDDLYSFTVVKVLLTNKTKSNLFIDLDSFRLTTKQFKTYKVDPDSNKYFIEFGTGYNNEVIKPLNSKEYILVFKVDKNEKTNDKVLEYVTGTKIKNNELVYNYAKFNLDLDYLNKEERIEEEALGKEIEFVSSLLGNTSINVKKVKFADNFITKVRECTNNKCEESSKYIAPKTLSKYEKCIMEVDYQLQLGQGVNGEVKNKFIEKFANVRYVIDNREYTHDINLVDITPTGIDGVSYLEVKEDIKKATKIYLDIRIRNKIYTYIIKG